jgi:hypothetical protein
MSAETGACQWLIGNVSDIWNPDLCKMVTSRIEHYPTDADGPATTIHIDDDYVDVFVWKRDPWQSDLLRRLDSGERIYTVERGEYRELLVQEAAPTPVEAVEGPEPNH